MANKVDKDRLDKIAQMGCFCCGRPAEVHHCRNINGNTGLSVRPSHQHTIPLCPTHHRTGKDSIHLGKNLFIEKYGTEQSILIKINKHLELMEDAYNLFGDK